MRNFTKDYVQRKGTYSNEMNLDGMRHAIILTKREEDPFESESICLPT